MATYSSELTNDTGLRLQAKVTETTQAAKKHSMKAINICLWFCSIFGAFVGLAYLLFDPIVKHLVLKRLVLSNDSEFAHIWQNPPITPHSKMYFFNLTNPKEFFDGKEKANLIEVGPYVYHQKWIKENVVWHANGTMSYQTRKIFTFMPELSVGDHRKDIITTLNVPVLSAYYQMRAANFITVWGLDTVIYSLEYDPWVRKTPEELIWGYDEPLFVMAKESLPNPPPFSKFGFFTKKNNSDDLATYTMHTGINNPYDLSKISLFNGKSHLKFWKTSKCNLVQGSDGATFNPYISRNDTLWFFNDQLCRSIPLVFDKEVTSRNLPGYRFKPRDDVYKSRVNYPENDCYCTDKDLCNMIGDGMFDVSSCQFDAPIILSWPHFLGANSSFRNAVSGMRPDPDRHGFWFDIQQTTGTTLSAKARIQINMAIKKLDTFETVSKIDDIIVPIMWFEEGLDELGSELIDVIGQAVIHPPIYKNYIFCIFLGMGVSTLIITIVAMVRLILNKRCRCNRESTLVQVRSILHEGGHLGGGGGGGGGQKEAEDDGVSAPMLPDTSSDYTTSTESSRVTTANHSRNSSTGSSPNYSAVVNFDGKKQSSTSIPESYSNVKRLKKLLDPKSKPRC